MRDYIGGTTPRFVSTLKDISIESLDIPQRTKNQLQGQGRFDGESIYCENLYDLYLLVKKIEKKNPFYARLYGLQVLCALTGIGSKRIRNIKYAIKKKGLSPTIFDSRT